MIVLGTTLAVVAGSMIVMWLVSLAVEDASIADVFWGVGFAIIAWTTFAATPDVAPRRLLVCVLTSAWGLRLAAFLAVRNLGHGEDRRYRAMREEHGARFPIRSLFTVFLFQGALMWIVALPVQAAQLENADAPLSALDVAGVVTFAVGLALESIADFQLLRWKRDARNASAALDRGLWRYSRHPNYFGETLVWWGLGAIAASAGAWWALVGPLTITFLLLRVSGVTLLERTIVDRRPGYREYMERTSAFVPWPPRAARRDDGAER